MRCDLCGANGNLFSAIVEKSLVNICKNCLKFGKQIERNKNFDVNDVIKKKPIEENIVLLKENYNVIIKENREKLKLTQEDLAKKLNEKISLIQKVENREITPNEDFIKKIEDFFRIKLYETYKNEKIKLNFQQSSLTIGDLIKLDRQKKS